MNWFLYGRNLFHEQLNNLDVQHTNMLFFMLLLKHLFTAVGQEFKQILLCTWRCRKDPLQLSKMENFTAIVNG